MEATWTDLFQLVRDSPRSSSRIRRTFSWLYSGLSSVLRRGTRGEIERFLRAGDQAARELAVGPDATEAELRYWYGGQCHAIVAICRTALAEHLSNETMRMVRNRRHWLPMLRALRQREAIPADLARELGIDPSTVTDMLNEMESRDLLTSEKAGRRWVRLLPLGEQAAIEDDETQERMAVRPVPFEVDLIAAAKALSPPEAIIELPQLIDVVYQAVMAAKTAASHLDHAIVKNPGRTEEPTQIEIPVAQMQSSISAG